MEVVLIRADGLEQLQHVVGVQGAGLGGHAAGQVGVSNVCDALETKKVKIFLKKTVYSGYTPVIPMRQHR